jgi:hypothetical protein
MFSATYRRELKETVARESAHLWAQPPQENEGGRKRAKSKRPTSKTDKPDPNKTA